MAFKKNSTEGPDRATFADQLKGLFIEEAGQFTGEKNESAAADVDKGAETLLRLSAEKNKKNRKAIKAQIRKVKEKEEGKEKCQQKAETRDSVQEAVSDDAVIGDNQENTEEITKTGEVAAEETLQIGEATTEETLQIGEATTEETLQTGEAATEETLQTDGASTEESVKIGEESTGEHEEEKKQDDGADQEELTGKAEEEHEENPVDPEYPQIETAGVIDDENASGPAGMDAEQPDTFSGADNDWNTENLTLPETIDEETELALDTDEVSEESDDDGVPEEDLSELDSLQEENSDFKPAEEPDDDTGSGDFKPADPFSDTTGIDDLKNEERSELRKGTAKVAAAKVLHAKRDLENDFSENYNATGDAFRDGSHGLAGTILTAINPMTYLKQWIASILAAAAPMAASMGIVIAIVLVIISILFSILQPIAESSEAVQGYLSIYTVNTGTFTNVPMSQSKIDGIVADIDCTETQEKVIRYALSKVGYPYSQNQRSSGNAYDCSSLAYYSWKNAGVDISYGTYYAPTAAEGARMLKADGKSVATTGGTVFSLEPGDLIYYGGKSNGRYMGIYHVAIYVGNGMAAEALSTKYGVVYQSLRTKNVCMICRPS